MWKAKEDFFLTATTPSNPEDGGPVLGIPTTPGCVGIHLDVISFCTVSSKALLCVLFPLCPLVNLLLPLLLPPLVPHLFFLLSELYDLTLSLKHL